MAKRLRSKFCQEISWWMKLAAIFATAGFTSVHTWAEKCIIYENNDDTIIDECSFPTDIKK
jgi:hypothetical protein